MSENIIKVTNEQIVTFRTTAEIWLRSADRDTKLFPAVDKMFKKLKKRQEHYFDKQQSIRRAHAISDTKTKKILLSNTGSYEYTADGAGKVEEELRELQYREISIIPDFVKKEDISDDLRFDYQMANGAFAVCTDYEVRNAFERFVIEPAYDTTELENEEETEY